MEDLTLQVLRVSSRFRCAVAALAFCIGMLGTLRAQSDGIPRRRLMMVLFFHAARLAMVDFDPVPVLAPVGGSDRTALLQGKLIVDHHYYWFSSVFFYTNRNGVALERPHSTTSCTVPTLPARPTSSSTTPSFGNFGLSPEAEISSCAGFGASSPGRAWSEPRTCTSHRPAAAKFSWPIIPSAPRTSPTVILRHSGQKTTFRRWRFLQLADG